MKLIIFLLILILSSHSYSKSNSNFDLKIGGIALYDNLFDYFTPKQVREKQRGYENYYKHLEKPFEFPTMLVTKHPLINKKYKRIEINFKEEKGQLIIHHIGGGEFYNNINLCYKDMNNLVEYISLRFPHLKKYGPETRKHPADSLNESKYTTIAFESKDSLKRIYIECYDWSKRLTKKNKWIDNLSYSLISKEFDDWKSNIKK